MWWWWVFCYFNIAAVVAIVVGIESWSTKYFDAIFISYFHLIIESKKEIRTPIPIDFFPLPLPRIASISFVEKQTIIIIFNCVIHARQAFYMCASISSINFVFRA